MSPEERATKTTLPRAASAAICSSSPSGRWMGSNQRSKRSLRRRGSRGAGGFWGSVSAKGCPVGGGLLAPALHAPLPVEEPGLDEQRLDVGPVPLHVGAPVVQRLEDLAADAGVVPVAEQEPDQRLAGGLGGGGHGEGADGADADVVDEVLEEREDRRLERGAGGGLQGREVGVLAQ